MSGSTKIYIRTILKCNVTNIINANSLALGWCHPHSKFVGKKFPFYQQIYPTSRQQQNITTNNP